MHAWYSVTLFLQLKFSLIETGICSHSISSAISDFIEINLPMPQFYIAWFWLYCQNILIWEEGF